MTIKRWVHPQERTEQFDDVLVAMPSVILYAPDPYFNEVLDFVYQHPCYKHLIAVSSVSARQSMKRVFGDAACAVTMGSNEDTVSMEEGIYKLNTGEVSILIAHHAILSQGFSAFQQDQKVAISCTAVLPAPVAINLAYRTLNEDAPRFIMFGLPTKPTPPVAKTAYVIKYVGKKGKSRDNCGNFYGGTDEEWNNYHYWVSESNAIWFSTKEAAKVMKAKLDIPGRITPVLKQVRT